MVALAQRPDGLVDVTFDDGSKVAMMPSVVESAGLYPQLEAEAPPPAQGQMAQAAQPDILMQHGVNPNVADWQVPKKQEVQLQAPTPNRVQAPGVGQRPEQLRTSPAESVAASQKPDVPTNVIPAPASAPAAPAKFSRTKAQKQELDPGDREALERGQLDVEGSRARTNIALQEQQLAQEPVMREVANYLDEAANQKENRVAAEQDRRQKAMDDFSRRNQILDKRLEELRNEPGARDKVMEDKGWLGKVLAGIALTIGSGLQVMTGQNPAKDILDQQVAEQVEKQDRKERLFGAEKTRLGELRKEFQDDVLAKQQLELEISEAQNARLQAFAASAESEQTRQAIQLILAQRSEEYQRDLQNFRMALAGKVATEYGWRGGGGGVGKKSSVMFEVQGPPTPQNPSGKMFMTPDEAIKYQQVQRNTLELSGKPGQTAASIREREVSARERELNTPWGRMWAKRDKDASGLEDSIVWRDEMFGALNHLKQLRKEILAETNSEKKQGNYERLQRAQQEAARVWGLRRAQGGYGVPTGKDEELIDREIGSIGQGVLSTKSILMPTFDASVDTLIRVTDRGVKAALNRKASTHDSDIIPPNLPLEDTPPDTGVPETGVRVLEKGFRNIPRPVAQ